MKTEEHDEPLRLGNVSEFSLFFSRVNSLVTSEKKGEASFEEESNVSDDEIELAIAPPDQGAALLAQFQHLQASLVKIRLPIWIIVVLLILSLFIHK